MRVARGPPHQPSSCLSSTCSSQGGHAHHHYRDTQRGTCTTPTIKRQRTGHAPLLALGDTPSLRRVISDRRSDMSGGRVPAHAVSDSSRTESPVPTVYRQETPALGSRLFEQFAGSPPAQVTRLDLHEEVEGEYDPRIATRYDRRQRGVPLAHPQNHHAAYASGPHRHNSQQQQQQQHHRRPSQRTFQEPIHVNLPSESSGTDVVQTMDNGDRIKIPRHPYERRPSRSGHAPASYGQPDSEGSNLNPERTYYIVPPGMSVIFRDEFGNELKRLFSVGDFSDGYDPNMYDEAPVELTDEYGRTVYK
ncbi:hypothetical protein BC827DRAFT_150393 [Russula dissimulans]|nr:hypothetical protein BC827DRAFT_150393 [Russula dissimulans]